MTDIAIPPASLERLRAAYAQFEQLAAVVAEALGIPPGEVRQISLPRGVFIVGDEQLAPERENGVAV